MCLQRAVKPVRFFSAEDDECYDVSKCNDVSGSEINPPIKIRRQYRKLAGTISIQRCCRAIQKGLAPISRRAAAARSLLFIVLLATLNTTSYSDQSIRVGVWRDDGGPLSGFARDILQQVADNKGWQLNYETTSSSELLEKLALNQIDLLLNVPYSKEYKDRFSFNDQYLINNWGEFYTAANSSLESLMDLGGKRIGVMESSPYVTALQDLLSSFPPGPGLDFVCLGSRNRTGNGDR